MVVGVVELACANTNAVVATCVVFVFCAAVGAAKLPAVLMLPPLMLPETVNAPSVPTLVIFVCAAVVRVPTMLVPLRLPDVMFPVTANEVNVPTLVMLGCAAVVSVPAILVPLRLPDVMFPVTASDPSVPTVVTCVWLALTEKVVPVNVKPVPALYVPAPENCTQVTALVPTVVTASGITQPVLSYNVPAETNVKSPPAISTGVSKSSARVNTVALVLT